MNSEATSNSINGILVVFRHTYMPCRNVYCRYLVLVRLNWHTLTKFTRNVEISHNLKPVIDGIVGVGNH